MNQPITVDAFNLVHFALAVFASLWGLALILQRGQARPLRYYGFLLILLAMNILLLCLFKADLIFRLPHLLGAQVPVIYLFGPCFYFFSRSVADAWKPTRIHLLHLAPVLIVFAAYIPLYSLSAEEKLLIMRAWDWETGNFGWRIYFIRIGILSVMAYYLLSLRTLYKGGMDARKSFLLLATGAPAIALFFWGQWLPKLEYTELGFVFVEAHLLAFYLLANREQNWLNQLSSSTASRTQAANSPRDNSAAQRESRLRNLDREALLRHLEYLMAEEKRFVDEDLDIGRLASMLGIKRHQLSSLLNHVIGKDFKSYLNGYRIVEAGELLLQEPERSVLSVAFAVGFNSKSAFNLVFRKYTGMTPTEFRQQNSHNRAG